MYTCTLTRIIFEFSSRAELTQEEMGGYKKPIEIGHVAEEGIEQANLVEGILRQQLDGS